MDAEAGLNQFLQFDRENLTPMQEKVLAAAEANARPIRGVLGAFAPDPEASEPSEAPVEDEPEEDGPTMTELRHQASELDIPGRSKMSRDELAVAIADALATAAQDDDDDENPDTDTDDADDDGLDGSDDDGDYDED